MATGTAYSRFLLGKRVSFVELADKVRSLQLNNSWYRKLSATDFTISLGMLAFEYVGRLSMCKVSFLYVEKSNQTQQMRVVVASTADCELG